MIGYDIDGVLADKPPKADKSWGKSNGAERKARQQQLLNWYYNAQPLLTPEQPFVAISARKENPLVRTITEDWIMRQPYGHLCRAIALLPVGRTIENTARFKTEIINYYQLTTYIEDNKEILKRLNCPDTQLFYWDKTMDEPVPFVTLKPTLIPEG
jgi:hypothetical protein